MFQEVRPGDEFEYVGTDQDRCGEVLTADRRCVQVEGHWYEKVKPGAYFLEYAGKYRKVRQAVAAGDQFELLSGNPCFPTGSVFTAGAVSRGLWSCLENPRVVHDFSSPTLWLRLNRVARGDRFRRVTGDAEVLIAREPITAAYWSAEGKTTALGLRDSRLFRRLPSAERVVEAGGGGAVGPAGTAGWNSTHAGRVEALTAERAAAMPAPSPCAAGCSPAAPCGAAGCCAAEHLAAEGRLHHAARVERLARAATALQSLTSDELATVEGLLRVLRPGPAGALRQEYEQRQPPACDVGPRRAL